MEIKIMRQKVERKSRREKNGMMRCYNKVDGINKFVMTIDNEDEIKELEDWKQSEILDRVKTMMEEIIRLNNKKTSSTLETKSQELLRNVFALRTKLTAVKRKMVISERELVHPFYKQLKPIYFSDLLEELINIQDDAAKRRCLECEKEKFELCPHEVKDIEARLETVGKVLASEDMSSHVTDLLILFEKLKQKIKIKFLTQEFNDQRNQRDLHPTDATPVGHLFADWTALKTTSPNRLFADCNQGDRRCLRNAFRLAQEDCENMIKDMYKKLTDGCRKK
eukprot:GHVN01023299.1.p1 GENE.GHVN01023299.1~~GHVN01023299.1.p1  ORF type:complete len:280 (-),score=47.23 GHVN01023299.1:202-1041(-)